jgi:hypothetical protein
LERWVLDWHGIVEHDHHTVTSVTFERTAVFDDLLANGRMVFTQQRHYVFRISAFGKTSEPAQVAEECGNLSAVALKLLLAPGCNDQISHLRRQEPSQPAHAFDFAYLVGDALFELLI